MSALISIILLVVGIFTGTEALVISSGLFAIAAEIADRKKKE